MRAAYRLEKRKKREKRSIFLGSPAVDPSLLEDLKKVSEPVDSTFVPDSFQLKALELIKEYDVLVCAPTGSGKTWIATQAIHMYLQQGKRIWYASPLKALSNSIYSQFIQEFGPYKCGIITGDRKENPEAPIIVGTTEILRNQLYDVMHQGTSLEADLIIMDEAHYMNDPERGVVWEETLIYTPPRVRLLLLSATISNAEEIAGWLEEIRGTKVKIVKSEKRPVPLKLISILPDGSLVPFNTEKGLNPKIKKIAGLGYGKINYGSIIAYLRELNLLPAIFFLKSRKDCDDALLSCSPSKTEPEVKGRLKQELNRFLRYYPHLRDHKHLSILLNCRVASHHAGHLPYWKLLVEHMMNKGLLEAIFSTSTVAAGVNFPARTVVLVQSDRFNGHEFVDLTATEFHQMTGRAGRRGKDNIGFVLIFPGAHQGPYLIHKLWNSPPEPIMSQLYINFSMVLNLLLSHEPDDIKELLERSFARYQERLIYGRISNWLWKSFKRHLRFLKQTGFVDKENRLTPDGIWASKLRIDHPLLIAEAIRKGAMSKLTPEELAGSIAPFVWDRGQDISFGVDEIPDIKRFKKVFRGILKSIKQIRELKRKRGFENPSLVFPVGVAIYLWAKGFDWNMILKMIPMDEGDMSSVVMRTVDHLRQITNLKDTHPELAFSAKEAIGLIMREPFYVEGVQ